MVNPPFSPSSSRLCCVEYLRRSMIYNHSRTSQLAQTITVFLQLHYRDRDPTHHYVVRSRRILRLGIRR